MYIYIYIYIYRYTFFGGVPHEEYMRAGVVGSIHTLHLQHIIYMYIYIY